MLNHGWTLTPKSRIDIDAKARWTFADGLFELAFASNFLGKSRAQHQDFGLVIAVLMCPN